MSKWLLNENKYTSMITCICSADMTGDGYKNLIVGRQDGNIEVYATDATDGLSISSTTFVHVTKKRKIWLQLLTIFFCL